MGRSGASWVASIDCAGVNSMMKSAKICLFTSVLGLYLMSNSLISIDNFISLQRFLVYVVFASLDIPVGTLTV